MHDTAHAPLDRLMARLVDFEVDELATDTGMDVQAGADPVEPEPSAAEPAEPASPAWAPDPNEWQQIVGTVNQLGQLLANQPDEPLEPLDPYAEDFGQTLEQRLEQRDERLIGQLREALAPLHEQQAQQWADEQTAALPGQLKHDFTSDALELVKGTGLQAPGDPSGIRWLGERLAAIEKAAASRAVEEYKRSLSGDPQPDTGPAVNGGGAQILDAPSSYDDIIAAHAARRTV